LSEEDSEVILKFAATILIPFQDKAKTDQDKNLPTPAQNKT